ncbi:hypothetical protein [Rhizosphaericola mali]|uniref:Glycosyltransferase RgtA/B/C/D-like domain-containing protein n=1 Tax=Rhizosphaericola mali TaxID=2545455 RepID=A0A5P2G5Y2_9BACT|nr:hypothetical protein [Rhizosphaericola mali]QES89282.1 hypothetical protein E0W69_011615 [Rhizosphaericola mali]
MHQFKSKLFFFKLQNKQSYYTLILIAVLYTIALIIRIESNTLNESINDQSRDSYSYIETANLIKTGVYFKRDIEFNHAVSLTKRPFIYPLFLMILGGQKNLILIIIIQHLIAVVCAYLMILFFEKIGGTHPLWLALAIALTPASIYFYHLIMSETLTMLCSSIILILLLNISNKKCFISLQIIIGILPFIRPIFFPFTICNLLFFICCRNFSFQLRLYAIIPVLLCTGSFFFNKYRTDYAHFSSIENINLVDFNITMFKNATLGGEKGINWDDSIQQKALQYHDFPSRSAYLGNVAKHEIFINGPDYAKFHIICSIKALFSSGKTDFIFFNPIGSIQNNQNNIINSYYNKGILTVCKNYLENYLDEIIKEKSATGKLILIYFIPVTLFQILKWPFICIGIYVSRQRILSTSGLYMIFFLCYNIFITGPVSNPRYLLPIDPIIFMAFALGAQNVCSLFKIENKKRIA